MTPTDDTAGRPAFHAPDFQLQRTFDAPRELVFRAWTQPEHLVKWWGPAGLTMLRCDMDLRPGGVFLYGMKTPDGHEMWGKWVFRDVRPPERLEFLVSFCDPQGTPVRHPLAADWPLEVLSTVTFTEAAGRTTLAMTGTPWNATAHEHQVFAGATPSMEAGWSGTFANFEAYLATLQAAR